MKLRKICQKIACSSFKVGDIVECMDNSRLANHAHRFLKKGNKYTIEHISPESKCVRFKETAMGYMATRFRKVD